MRLLCATLPRILMLNVSSSRNVPGLGGSFPGYLTHHSTSSQQPQARPPPPSGRLPLLPIHPIGDPASDIPWNSQPEPWINDDLGDDSYHTSLVACLQECPLHSDPFLSIAVPENIPGPSHFLPAPSYRQYSHRAPQNVWRPPQAYVVRSPDHRSVFGTEITH